MSRLIDGVVLSAAVAVAAHWSGLLLIVGTHPVPGWAPGGALLGVALIVGLSRRSAPARPGPNRWRWALALLTLIGCLAGGLADAFARYHLLEPYGPGGCRAVARETAFLFAGSGQVYTGHVIGPMGIAWRGTSWTADDGHRPIAAGDYELSWGFGGGSLVVEGSDGDPVWPALHGVDCG
ncbi:hypothetical protein Q0Z83_047390 [Actinoplanes sichuanensis]|uniref:Uncharacterized protein n=1 Tax=Actinoplanes sichuanensis TaxID=512349 RepID=A0ABW4A8G8_9ACTN|nr:hypothetical protein [Actinoplanes sichuanensis]BEL06548.1 hypothetical protein Q0Z83_047390 [Actinoplanes sichuanensis]